MKIAEWIAVDWGTSNLRVWVFDDTGEPIQFLSSDKGMGALQPDQFEQALLDLIDPFLGTRPTPVICCGMVGAKQGWSEAAYAQSPCAAPDASNALRVMAKDPRIMVRILPGVSQNAPADVMRGEETQIAGYLSSDPQFYGTLCLPGTHTKWAQISAQEIVSFRTFMTGELFALLSKNSVLRHGMQTDDWSDDDFIDAVNDAIGAPQQLASRLFGLRAEGLLNGLSAQAARSRLSGYLIGLELSGSKHYWLGQDLVLIGDSTLNGLYSRALEGQGANCRLVSGNDMTLAGLKAAYQALKEE